MRGEYACLDDRERERGRERGVKGEGKIRKSRRTCGCEVEILVTKSFFLRCDACSRLFCKDHLLYDDHACSGKYKKDIQVCQLFVKNIKPNIIWVLQVPVCPLCSSPVPIARGAVPDLAVSAHIDQGCPAKNKKEKVFKNRCHAVKNGKQCKKHELVACICATCHTNFCLAHRHPTDHDCKGSQPAAARAAAAAASRAVPKQQQQQSSQSKMTDFFTGPFRPSAAASRVSSNPSPAAAAALNRQAGRGSTPGRPLMASSARQVNGMSEDEALAAAMAASLATSGGEGGGAAGGLSQEEEDLALARALQESEAMARRQGMAGGQQGQGVGQGDKNCSLQ